MFLFQVFYFYNLYNFVHVDDIEFCLLIVYYIYHNKERYFGKISLSCLCELFTTYNYEICPL